MILKGNQRAGGADLATHLQNGFDNERVEVQQVRGTVAADLHGAFSEFEAAAAGTRCKQPLYSLSINPSAPLTREQYAVAIERIEERLGFTGQPRAVVFHVKRGREHCHVVWSRIDTERMKAVQLSHDHQKLRALCRELAKEFGLKLPPGLEIDQGPDRDPKPDMTLGEKAQAEATGVSPAARRAEITAAWKESDGPQAFMQALGQRGYQLARGDRRAFVVVDRYGQIHSLARYIEGVKTKEVKAKLAPVTPEALLPAAEVAASIRACVQEAEAETARSFKAANRRAEALKALAARQEKRRREIESLKQEMLIRHAQQRLKLHAAQKAEADRHAAERARADGRRLSAVLYRVPGYAKMVRYFRGRQDARLDASHTEADQALRGRQGNERLDFERRFTSLDKIEARERRSLEVMLTRTDRVDERAREAETARKQAEFTVNAADITQPAATAEGHDKAPEKAPEKAGSRTSWKERTARLAAGRKGVDRGQGFGDP